MLIVNPNATSTTSQGRDLLAHALASRLQLEVVQTTHRGHAAELAHRAALEQMTHVIVHGGDGTVNETVNGLLGAPRPAAMRDLPPGRTPVLGVVPGGSANVFARNLGIAPDPVAATNQLLELLAAGTTRRIGLGHCDNRWFTFTAGLGVDALVVEAMEAARAAGHPATSGRYLRTTVRTFLKDKRRAPQLTVHLPGAEPVPGVHYAFVSNTNPWTYLEQRPVTTNPGTSFDSGLGVFAALRMGLPTTMRLARQLLARTGDPRSPHLLRTDDVPTVRITAETPAAFQIDGDFLGRRSEVVFAAEPDMLTVAAPAAR